jgi:hypothetical protein
MKKPIDVRIITDNAALSREIKDPIETISQSHALFCQIH